MYLTLEYDETVLTLKRAENGAAVTKAFAFTPPGVLRSGYHFLWDATDARRENGAALELRFDVAPGAEKGTYPVMVSYQNGDIPGEKGPVYLAVVNGSITVD